MDEELERWMVKMSIEQGPKLISIGNGVVDAREIVAVIEIHESDWLKVLESGERIPNAEYVRSHVMTQRGVLVASDPADVIIIHWRQALGGLPGPIGS